MDDRERLTFADDKAWNVVGCVPLGILERVSGRLCSPESSVRSVRRHPPLRMSAASSKCRSAPLRQGACGWQTEERRPGCCDTRSVIVEPVAPGSQQLKAVIGLHRRNSGTLGFVPFAGFDERAERGTLIACLDTDAVVGYALYDLPEEHIALRHLCVDEGHRRKGVARELVDFIRSRHGERRGIRLRCRRDYPAAHLWPHLDFAPVVDLPGHSQAGHLLTTWWLDFGHPNLFSYLAEESSRLKVAVDADVFYDLFEDRPGCEESRGLLNGAVTDQIDLCATKELSQEINNHSSGEIRAQRWRQAQMLTAIDSPEPEWREAERKLLDWHVGVSLSGHDTADVRHIARAASAGAQVFVTRDEELIGRWAEVAKRELALDVLTPAHLIQRLFQEAQQYAPVAIENTVLTRRLLAPDEIDAAVAVFLNSADGERGSSLKRRLRRLLADPAEWSAEVVASGDQLLALVVHHATSRALEAAVLRAVGSDALTIARHVVHGLRERAVSKDLRGVVVTDPEPPGPVRAALVDESFVWTGSDWVSVCVSLTGPASALAEELGAVASEWPDETGLRLATARLQQGAVEHMIVAELERRFWPMKITDQDLPTFVVPIEAVFAEKLFDTELSAQTLYPRPSLLGLSCEHIYYRSPRPSVLTAPARILWYIMEERGRAGTKAIRACSRLEEVQLDHPKTLYRRFRHLGVWGEREVVAVAKRGRAMALRFTDTEPFDNPVPLAAVRRLCPKLVLQGPSRVSEHVFDTIYRRGVAHAH